MTPMPEHGHLTWWRRPATIGVAVLALTLALNLVFW